MRIIAAILAVLFVKLFFVFFAKRLMMLVAGPLWGGYQSALAADERTGPFNRTLSRHWRSVPDFRPRSGRPRWRPVYWPAAVRAGAGFPTRMA